MKILTTIAPSLSGLLPNVRNVTLIALISLGLHAIPLMTIAGDKVPHRARAVGQIVSSEELPPSDSFPFGSTKYLAIGEGNGTHDGLFTEINEFEIGVQLTPDGPALVIEGTLTVITANGDEVVWVFNLETPGFAPPFDFEGPSWIDHGTGRWEGASGFAVAKGTLFADGSYEYRAEGWVSSVGSNKTK